MQVIDIDTGVFTEEALKVIASMYQDGVMQGDLKYQTSCFPLKQMTCRTLSIPKVCGFTDGRDEKEFARRFRLADSLDAFQPLIQPKFVADEKGNMYILHNKLVGFCVLSYDENRRVGEEYVLFNQQMTPMLLEMPWKSFARQFDIIILCIINLLGCWLSCCMKARLNT